MAEATQNPTGLLSVRLVAPDRVLLDATAETVELPAAAGYIDELIETDQARSRVSWAFRSLRHHPVNR